MSQNLVSLQFTPDQLAAIDAAVASWKAGWRY